MIGVRAAEELMTNLTGLTVHRRGLRVKNNFYDCHTRLSDAVITGAQLDPHYLASLGLELSSLDRGIFDTLIDTIKAAVDPLMPDDHRFGDAPFLANERSEPALFRRVRATCFHGVVRNYMGKIFDIIFEKESFLSIIDIFDKLTILT